MKGAFQVEYHLNKYPKLDALMTRVQNYPPIAEWIKRRPVTPR